MQNPTFSKFFATLTLLVVTGCATATYPPPITYPQSITYQPPKTYQPPRIEGDRYTNYDYIYTVEIPDGWKIQEKFARELVLENYTDNGSISIHGEKANIDWYEYSKAGTDIPYLTWLVECGRFIAELNDETGVTVLASEVYGFSTEVTHLHWIQSTGLYKPEKLLEVKYRVESLMHKYDAYTEIIPYPCSDQETCILHVSLNSAVGTLDKYKESFKNIVKSLRVHDYTQNPSTTIMNQP